MILTFSIFKEKILDGTKTQTIRPYSEFQWKRFCNAKKYQLYWHNPRNGGTLIKEVESDCIPVRFSFKSLDPDTFIKIAMNDGFETAGEMHSWFYHKYGEKMFTMEFMLLRWKS
jgi:hypothetical protein